MFSGGNRTTQATFIVKDDRLRIRPYNQALNDLTNSLCKEIGQEGNDTCLFETRTAFDCLLRSKVSKGGDIMDNVNKCKFHIANLKSNVSRCDAHNRFFDEKLKELNNMPRAFC